MNLGFLAVLTGAYRSESEVVARSHLIVYSLTRTNVR